MLTTSTGNPIYPIINAWFSFDTTSDNENERDLSKYNKKRKYSDVGDDRDEITFASVLSNHSTLVVSNYINVGL